jgi:amidase
MKHETPNPIIYSSASCLAESIRRGELSSVEVVNAHLDRIAQVNPQLNAVIHLLAESARARAEEADRARARGENWGPLHGVPVSVKDAFDTAGIVSTGGTQGRAAYVPMQDATAVARLKAAGAIILGKTNLPELSLAFETDNVLFGKTNNPYDLTRTAGGSSGGEAALIAAGGSPLGIGTDAAGSLRVPAHFSGIASLKPTLGRVPMTGAFPPPLGATGRFWHVGPLARQVEDLRLALQILAGPDNLDPMAAPVSLGEGAPVRVRDLKVAFFTNNGIVTPTPETSETVRRAAQGLQGAGARVEEERPANSAESFELAAKLFALDGGVGVGTALHIAGTTQVSQQLGQLNQILQPFIPQNATDSGNILLQWDIFRQTLYGFMQQYDVIVSPVLPFPALPHGTTFDADRLPGFSYTMMHNLSGLPAAVVRGGTSPEGLPIGVQIVAKPWREDMALAVAEYIEMEMGGWQAPLL